MKRSTAWLGLCAALFVLGFPAAARAEETLRIQGAMCPTPAILDCPASECSAATVINPGPVVEMKTRRTYFLDYPCDLKKGEKVTFILSLHGGGSYGNWQRHYFPLKDYAAKYRLVIATPNSPIRAWSDADDEYLKNIVEFVVAQVGKENVRAFWLAGHSQGGMTSNRLVRTDFFKSRVDGWLSLSGGRLGGPPGRPANFGPGPGAGTPNVAAAAPGTGPGPDAARAAAMALLRELPAIDMSFIYTTGQREMDEKGLPAASEWATRYGCGAQSAATEIVDTRAGYVYDPGRLNQMRPSWGLLPGPGKAALTTYPSCKSGRVVADVVRIDKGHTEGLEPQVSEELVKLIVSAPGGKIQRGE
jgi:poly(3-hydroxybutyrate) depolymerase